MYNKIMRGAADTGINRYIVGCKFMFVNTPFHFVMN